jgi:nicotinamide-nucleotide amidase
VNERVPGLVPVKIIAIGDELLEGRTVDTNSQRIQRSLGGHGVQVALIQVVPDTEADVLAALQNTAPGDLVFVSGGLGSTPDDMTREMIACWGGVPLREDETVRAHLTERWRRRGIKAGAGVLKQCQVPAGMRALANPVGSAPGLLGRLKGRYLAMLPGVPPELAGLLPLVVAALEAEGVLPEARPNLVWRTAQIAELALVKRCAAVRDAYPHLRWSWWLTDWGVDVRLSCNTEAGRPALAAAGQDLDAILGHLVYTRDDRSSAQVVQDRMVAAGATLSVAESCTAGLLGGALTAGAGSSAFFRGGILAYADDVKHRLLGVPEDILQQFGAVSEETVRFMAAGCRHKLGTDYALAVSGISGPGGGSVDKPVGTTWLAVATPQRVYAGRYRFPADRDRNRLLTVAAAIDTLRRVLEFGDEQPPWTADDTWCTTQ